MSYLVLPNNKIILNLNNEHDNEPVTNLVMNNDIINSEILKNKIFNFMNFLITNNFNYNDFDIQLKIKNVFYKSLKIDLNDTTCEYITLCEIVNSYSSMNRTCNIYTNYNIEILYKIFKKYKYQNNLSNDNTILKKYELLILTNECDNIIDIINIIFSKQKQLGTCILQIDNVNNEYNLQIIYILNCFYKKGLVFKSNNLNINSNSYFFIFEKFISIKDTLISKIQMRCNNIKNSPNSFNTIDNSIEIPICFKNKIKDIILIQFQQKLELVDNLYNMLTDTINLTENIINIQKQQLKKVNQWVDKNFS